jgi:hypothetical protein
MDRNCPLEGVEPSSGSCRAVVRCVGTLMLADLLNMASGSDSEVVRSC